MSDPVEQVLWDAARLWRTPEAVVVPSGVDWHRLVEVAAANRAEPLLARALLGDAGTQPPASIVERLREADGRAARWAATVESDLAAYLAAAHERGVDTIVMKGLALGHEIYRDPGLRPGVDIDLLVAEADVDASLEALEEIGFGPFWPNLLDDSFYRRHHLHIERCSEDWMRWFEVHWALDHPATSFLIDYDAIFARSTAGTLVGEPVRVMADEDLLASLAVHLVKHAVYLPTSCARADLGRAILGDGLLLLVLDIAEVLQARPSLDWSLLEDRARSWRARAAVSAALEAANRLLGAAVPEATLGRLRLDPPGPVTGRVMDALAEAEARRFAGEEASRGWDLLLGHRGGLGLRPVRLLGAADYLRPGDDYLIRCYGDSRRRTGLRHAALGLGRYTKMAVEAGRASRRRDRHLRATGQYESAKAHLDLGP